MAHLKDNPTLNDLQRYIAEVCAERGWTKDSPAEKFVLFIEEIGELAKAMRKSFGLYEEKAKQRDMALYYESCHQGQSKLSRGTKWVWQRFVQNTAIS